jgi:hypothetical protein
MVGTRYINEVKIEGEDGEYPPVDTRAGRDVRIRLSGDTGGISASDWPRPP